MKVAVAGAGIAGSCVTRVLRERGHEVTVVDRYPQWAASRCAFAVNRMSWWTGEQREAVRTSLAWYRTHGYVITDEATVHDVLRDRVTVQGDHYLIDPLAPLVTPDLMVNLDQWEDTDGGVSVLTDDGTGRTFDALVIACGPASADLTGGRGTSTYGGMYAAPGNLLTDPGPLALLRRTDRLSYTVCFTNGETRVGASRRVTAALARADADKILNMVTKHGLVLPDLWEYRSGRRYATAQPGLSQLDTHTYSLTGLARSGYALAPQAALRLAVQLETRR
jgi:glycine/D-amino acid oxidase-like deaminating enzyme